MTVSIRPIKTEKDYEESVKRVDELILKSERVEEEEAELDLLSDLIWLYEEEHYRIDPPSNPIEAIHFVMEQRNLKPSDLASFLGNESDVLEVLSGKRVLSIDMIKGLHKGFGIPYECLMGG